MWREARQFVRFAAGLGPYIRATLSPQDCLAIVQQSLQAREQNFRALLLGTVFAYKRSPYLALLRNAGIERGDCERMLGSDGLDATLDRLFDAGVYITLEEAKGLRPIQRGNFTLPTSEADFYNPLLFGGLTLSSGGSSGPQRPIVFDLDSLAIDSAQRFLAYQAHGVERMPSAMWRPPPPSAAGLTNALSHVKTGNPLERWFTPFRWGWRAQGWKSSLFGASAVRLSRFYGGAIPAPEHVPLDCAEIVAQWLAEKTAGGGAFLSSPTSAAVRVCQAAQASHLDISGSFFRVGGEPLTPSRAEFFRSSGARVTTGYALTEAGGVVGAGCARPEHADEVHVFDGRFALQAREKTLQTGEIVPHALYLTTLSPTAPKVLLNLETGDHGEVTERDCGCPLHQLGLRRHLHNIRSYEKLTAGGMHFLGARFLDLVEQVLPARFGGAPTDFQFVERADQIEIRVSPRVGAVDEQALTAEVLRRLAAPTRADQMMAELWRDGAVLRVSRREPQATPGGKIPALINSNRNPAPEVAMPGNRPPFPRVVR